jgi:hypothetical protein
VDGLDAGDGRAAVVGAARRQRAEADITWKFVDARRLDACDIHVARIDDARFDVPRIDIPRIDDARVVCARGRHARELRKSCRLDPRSIDVAR